MIYWLQNHVTIFMTVVFFCISSFSFAVPSQAQMQFEVPTEKLRRLSPNDFSQYRDLAEEFSPIGQPVAQDLTIRLYLICAAQSKGKLRRSALRGLIHSARNTEEQQTFKVLGFLTDPAFSNVLFLNQNTDPNGNASSRETEAQGSPREKLLEALMFVRQGKPQRAQKIMEDTRVQQLFNQLNQGLTRDPLADAFKGELSNQTLYSLLKIELQLRNPPERSLSKTTSWATTDLWRKLFKGQLPDRTPTISFESVTEFNPAHSVFRNGTWQRPSR
ncbi:MAG: hypothetical protein VX438_04030 [Planctomycetota bacterium]|nr:hypothetical protein [Planctomycetota bacterium]